MAETLRLEAEAYVDKVLAALDAPVYRAREEAHAALREKAVLANAEGWQSGPIEDVVEERPWDIRLKVKAWMVLTRG